MSDRNDIIERLDRAADEVSEELSALSWRPLIRSGSFESW